MTPESSFDWRPEIVGWSSDILPFYRRIVPSLPRHARCVEVGCLNGRSVIFLREELVRGGRLGSLTAIDPGVEDLGEKYDVDGHSVFWDSADQLARNCLLHAPEVRILREASPGAARHFEDASLDLVFLDGDHREDPLRREIAAWLPKMAAGGVLSGHDFGHPKYPGVARAVVDLLGNATIEDSVWWTKIVKP